jgi:hypothetical protein
MDGMGSLISNDETLILMQSYRNTAAYTSVPIQSSAQRSLLSNDEAAAVKTFTARFFERRFAIFRWPEMLCAKFGTEVARPHFSVW